MACSTFCKSRNLILKCIERRGKMYMLSSSLSHLWKKSLLIIPYSLILIQSLLCSTWNQIQKFVMWFTCPRTSDSGSLAYLFQWSTSVYWQNQQNWDLGEDASSRGSLEGHHYLLPLWQSFFSFCHWLTYPPLTSTEWHTLSLNMFIYSISFIIYYKSLFKVFHWNINS